MMIMFMVGVIVRMAGRMGVAVVMTMPAQDQHAQAIDYQSGDGNRNGRVELDGDRIHGALNAFPNHDDRKDTEQNRAGIAAQRVDLAGAEREAAVMGVMAGIDIGERTVIPSASACVPI